VPADGPAAPQSRWTWRERVAQVASFSGGLGLLRRISRTHELRSVPGHRLPSIRRVSQPKYLILCYHRVGTEGIPYYCTLPVGQFETQMRYLRNHCRVLSLSQLVDELNHRNASASHAVAVTFDDGYSDLYHHALPILCKYEIPATVYLTADCIETGEVAWYDRIFLALQVACGDYFEVPIDNGLRLPLGSVERRIESAARIVSILRKTPVAQRRNICALLEQQIKLPAEKLQGRMLSWQQVREMRSAGVFFGSHTLSHPVLSQLSLEEAERELGSSKTILEKNLHEPILDFAFPFGRPEDCGPFAYEAAAHCGYRSAVTTTWGYNTAGANMHTLRRVQLGEERTEASFALQLHQAFFRASDDVAASVSVGSLPNTTGEAPTRDGVLAQR